MKKIISYWARRKIKILVINLTPWTCFQFG